MERKTRRTPPFSVGGLILVVLGVILLLQNLGVLPWGVWGAVWRFWPVILVLIGLSILLRWRASWLMLGITIVVLLAAIGAALIVPASRPSGASTSFSRPLQGAANAEVAIDFGAGDLAVDSLPTGSLNLAEGTGSPEVKEDFRLRGSTAVVRLSVSGRRVFWFPGGQRLQLRVSLNPSIPTELTVKTGASNAQIDLTGLTVSRLLIEAGASNLQLRLPAQAGHSEAVVKAGAAQLSVAIPQEVAARITTTAGLSSLRVDTSRFPKADDRYESPDYATAVNRVDLQIESGVSSVEIR